MKKIKLKKVRKLLGKRLADGLSYSECKDFIDSIPYTILGVNKEERVLEINVDYCYSLNAFYSINEFLSSCAIVGMSPEKAFLKVFYKG